MSFGARSSLQLRIHARAYGLCTSAWQRRGRTGAVCLTSAERNTWRCARRRCTRGSSCLSPRRRAQLSESSTTPTRIQRRHLAGGNSSVPSSSSTPSFAPSGSTCARQWCPRTGASCAGRSASTG
eukprot:1946434-Rhodomonas_salina.1